MHGALPLRLEMASSNKSGSNGGKRTGSSKPSTKSSSSQKPPEKPSKPDPRKTVQAKRVNYSKDFPTDKD